MAIKFCYILSSEKCDEIDGRYPSSVGNKKEAHSGFNVGFELRFWCRWCQLLNRKPFVPVKKTVKMMNSEDDNFMKQHLKLRYTEGDVWFYLKAETEKDSETMLKVIIRINAASYDNSLALVLLSRKLLREKTFTDFAIFRPSSKVSP